MVWLKGEYCLGCGQYRKRKPIDCPQTEHYVYYKWAIFTNTREYILLRESMLRTQKDCAICHRVFGEKLIPEVDHDHKTGKVRKLLCRKCNARIWQFERIDDRIAHYLSKIEEIRKSRTELIHYLSEFDGHE